MNRRSQRLTTAGSTWPSAVQRAAAAARVSPDSRRFNAVVMTATEYWKPGTTRASKSVTVRPQLRQRRRRWHTMWSPSTSRRCRGRRPCAYHRSPPHFEQRSAREAGGSLFGGSLPSLRSRPTKRRLRGLLLLSASLDGSSLATDHWVHQVFDLKLTTKRRDAPCADSRTIHREHTVA